MKQILRILSIPVATEGLLMLVCSVVGLLCGEPAARSMMVPAAVTIAFGLLCLVASHPTLVDRLSPTTSKKARDSKSGNTGAPKMAYLGVTLLWLVLAAFGAAPLLATGVLTSPVDAFFESMSGFTTAGATVMEHVEGLPRCVILWRSLSQWVGGFGIVLLVLAVVPSLGMGNYSLYTAETSSADNSSKLDTSMSRTIRHTLTVYLTLTALFIALLIVSGLSPWQAVNLTFTHISSGGFAIFDDGIASLTAGQQYILLAAMMLSGVNFAFLYSLFTLRARTLRHKLDQVAFYLLMAIGGTLLATLSLHFKAGDTWTDAVRLGAVQSASALTTTGTQVADTRLWWQPLTMLLLLLAMCGGMAGSTSGGLKVMRVLILLRNVKVSVVGRLHPHAVNPVRLNGKPVPDSLVTNVLVIFFVYLFTLVAGTSVLLLAHVSPTEAMGDAAACLSGYGPGLGACGGFGSYMHLPSTAKIVCSLLMLMGRLECITVLILLVPAFWKK